MRDSLVIIPTYNEKENVVKMLETVIGLEFPFDVLIVDDGSPDGTARLVEEVASNFPDMSNIVKITSFMEKIGLKKLKKNE